MNADLILLALLVGAANYAFRVGPILRGGGGEERPDGLLARFLQSTGPAAIATLVAASLVPLVRAEAGLPLPALAGVATVLAVWTLGRSVVAATIAGAVAYGAAFAALGPAPLPA